MDNQVVLQMMKAVAWERAKGELRAMVALDGHRRLLSLTASQEQECSDAWRRHTKIIEDFILMIENEGIAE